MMTWLMPTYFWLVDQNGRKVVCGSQTGVILLYSWGCFKDCRYIMWNTSELRDRYDFVSVGEAERH